MLKLAMQAAKVVAGSTEVVTEVAAEVAMEAGVSSVASEDRKAAEKISNAVIERKDSNHRYNFLKAGKHFAFRLFLCS